MISRHKTQKGFGIAEVLIAATIIAVILGALVAAGQAALRALANQEQRLQAAGFAQEGLEIVRQMRDSNWIDGKSATEWDFIARDTMDQPVALSNLTPYRIAYYPISDTAHPNSNGRFFLTEGSNQEIAIIKNVKYYRTITVKKGDSLLELLPNGSGPDLKKYAFLVTAEVKIGDINGKKISISELMTDWRPRF